LPFKEKLIFKFYCDDLPIVSENYELFYEKNGVINNIVYIK